ncbi:MAG: polysaccharide biosynthesis protein [Hyphomicrobiaceae bacterium]
MALRLGLSDFNPLLYLHHALLFMVCAAIANVVTRLNKGVWRYASLPELIAIVKFSLLTVTLFAFSAFLLTRLDKIPRTVLIISLFTTVVMVSSLRIAYRLLRDRRATRRARHSERRNVLLIGAGDDAGQFVKAVSERTDFPYKLVGLVDDRARRVGLTIHGIEVLGGLDQLDDIVERLSNRSKRVQAVVLTKSVSSLGGKKFDALIDLSLRHNLELLHVPDLRDLSNGPDRLTPRRVKVEDLLSRAPARLDDADLTELLAGATVLVTGAGGSIGSELCRQILKHNVGRLILVDHSEYLLFTIHQQLLNSGVDIQALLCSVRDCAGIQRLFAQCKPDIVVHAAALKHVPIVELQPLEGLHTNVLGTRNVADAALACRARAMVVVSTDKAVNPTNVMGASKRVAEMYCQALDKTSDTRFVTVRFGNVLGSAGSVIPIFERQIASGGPVSVTHPDMQRYFMTIPEASSLILHSASFALKYGETRGRIFVLNMGEPVNIADMARRMIQLAGFRPDVDIRIKFTGLRPGEKLFEELFSANEELVGTEVESVMQASPQAPELRIISGLIDELAVSIEHGALLQARDVLRRANCGWQPQATTKVA